MLCPLNAILACDVDEPAGADCTTDTDDQSLNPPTWIWCAEEIAEDANAFSGGRARVFAGQGDTFVVNEVDYKNKTNSYISYCCSFRP